MRVCEKLDFLKLFHTVLLGRRGGDKHFLRSYFLPYIQLSLSSVSVLYNYNENFIVYYYYAIFYVLYIFL